MTNGQANEANGLIQGEQRPPDSALRRCIGGLPELIETVRRLQEAALTLRRLRMGRLKPSALHSGWPEVVRNAFEAFNSADPDKPRVVLPVPSAAAISRMDEAFQWFFLVERWQAGLVMARLLGVRWRKLEGHFNKCERTLRDAYWTAVVQISNRRKKLSLKTSPDNGLNGTKRP